jgi:phosphoglycolate phosphatase-like HAD superfamily hydrolase
LDVINADAPLGQVRHALFDFDGTISTIRQGWEEIMRPLMMEMISDGVELAAERRAEIEAEVADYVDLSTGILTIKQMEWLAEAVRRYGMAQTPRSAREYKAIYNERLLRPVRARLERLARGEVVADELMVAGARRFVEALSRRGVALYLASGTDHVYVAEESGALGMAPLFGSKIYGALDETEAHDKALIIQRILDDHGLRGTELLVVGDGPVEIREAKARGALALGVASNEVERSGWNERKRQRLLKANADLLIGDFTHADDLARLLIGQ